MLQTKPKPESISLSRYLTYLKRIIRENREPKARATFDSYTCGAFIQDNFPIVTTASFERLQQILKSQKFLKFSGDERDGDRNRMFFELRPIKHKNPIIIQINILPQGRRQSLMSPNNSHIDYEPYPTLLSFHGGSARDQKDRSYEFVRGVAAVLDVLGKSDISLAVPWCSVENRPKLLVQGYHARRVKPAVRKFFGEWAKSSKDGEPPLKALAKLETLASDSDVKDLIRVLRADIGKGGALVDSLRARKHLFPGAALRIMENGGRGGQLDIVLEDIAGLA